MWWTCASTPSNVDSLTKKNQWYTIDYHWIPFSINDISAGFGGTLNGNLKYHSIPANGTKNPKYHSKYHSKNLSDTIKIPMAIIPPRTIQTPFKNPLKPIVFECYFFVRACPILHLRNVKKYLIYIKECYNIVLYYFRYLYMVASILKKNKDILFGLINVSNEV